MPFFFPQLKTFDNVVAKVFIKLINTSNLVSCLCISLSVERASTDHYRKYDRRLAPGMYLISDKSHTAISQVAFLSHNVPSEKVEEFQEYASGELLDPTPRLLGLVHKRYFVWV